MSTRDEARMFDVRTLERNLRKGVVNRKDHERYLKALPDVADKAMACNPEAQREVVRRPPPVRAHVAAPPADGAADALEPAVVDDDDDDLDDDDEGDEDEGDDGGDAAKAKAKAKVK